LNHPVFSVPAVPTRLEVRPLFCAGNSAACLPGLPRYCRAHAPATAYGTAGTDTVFTETVMETAPETVTETDTGTTTLCWKPGVTQCAVHYRPPPSPLSIATAERHVIQSLSRTVTLFSRSINSWFPLVLTAASSSVVFVKRKLRFRIRFGIPVFMDIGIPTGFHVYMVG